MMKTVLRGLILTACLFWTSAFAETLPLPYMKASDFTPFWKGAVAGKDPAPAAVDVFNLKNQANQILTENNMKGHVSLVNFFFTGCGSVCPRLMSQMKKLQQELTTFPGIRIYSFSVAPDQDSPSQLSSFAKARTLNLKNWDLVTGQRAEIYRLGRDIFRADRNPDGTISSSQFIHTQAIYLLDNQLRIRGVYQSDKANDMALLVQDVSRLVRE